MISLGPRWVVTAERSVVLAGAPHVEFAFELGTHHHGMLAVALFHAVCDKRYPCCSALGDKHFEVGVTIERAGHNEFHHRALSPEARLGVIQNRAPGAAAHHSDCATGCHVDGLGADMEGDNHPDVLGERPERFPVVLVVILLHRVRCGGMKKALKPSSPQRFSSVHASSMARVET
jgi:hypothetical protein